VTEQPQEDRAVAPEAAGSIGASDQRRASDAEQKALVESVTAANSVLGRDLAVDLTGLVAEHDRLNLSPAAVAIFNALLYGIKEGKERAEAELRQERERTESLRERAANAETNAAVYKSERDAARRESNFRQIIGTIGGAIFGFTPYAYDKGSIGGGIIAAVGGVAIIVVAWLYRAKADR
jgi:hypothetical protein